MVLFDLQLERAMMDVEVLECELRIEMILVGAKINHKIPNQNHRKT